MRRASSRRAPSSPSAATRVRLAPAGVLAGAFPERRSVALGVEKVVGDLKRRPDRAAVRGERRARRRSCAREPRARLDAEPEERARLHRLQTGDLFAREGRGRGLRLDVEHLSADHSGEARGARQSGRQCHAGFRVRIGPWIGQDFEGERLQRVPGQNRRRLVEGAMRGRTAPPQIVVVHRRKVVMDQRIGMHAFDRRASAPRPAVGPAERARGLDHEKGPEPLPAAERGVAHRFDETLRPQGFSGLSLEAKQVLELALDRLSGLREPRLECAQLHEAVGLRIQAP